MNRSALAWLCKVPGGKKLYIVFLVLVQAIHGASGVLYALLLRGIVDAASVHDGAGFRHAVLLTVLLVAAQLALRALIRWLNELSRSEFENTFKRRLAQTLYQRDYLEVNAVHSAEWLNRLTNDTVVVAESYVEIVPGLAGMAVKLISATCMIIALEPRFAMILIPGGALVILFTFLFRRILKRMHRSVQESDGRLRIFLQERISSMLIVRSFAAEEETLRETDALMNAHQESRMRKNRFSNFCNVGFGAAMNGMYLLGVCYCGYGILHGTITFGTLTAITQLISQIQSPFANISGYLPRFYAMIASAERLMEAENFAPGLEPAEDMDAVRAFYEQLNSIGLDSVDFSYDVSGADDKKAGAGSEDLNVLKDFSVEIRKGSITAFTGHSGCGKSTALRLLMCVFEPECGQRYYTTASNESADTRFILSSRWRRLFAYVPQGNLLMSGSIRDIVSFADPEAKRDKARIRMSLKAACADEFVEALEQGVDTILGERGTGLSEGQMQRIAVARAVFSESPVLLLDEATSALDTDTERRLLANLRSLTGRTVVIVTHRPAVLDICDSVIEFKQ